MLTGDTLFVGDVARPDLAIEKSEGARGIFRSLNEKLLTLPDSCEVWPGHLGGSMCGGPGMDMKISSTIGYERANNPVLRITDEDEFVEQALAKLGPQPPNFQAIVDLNRGPLLTDGVHLLPLAPRQVQQLLEEDALVVDVRTDLQFDEAHIAGSVCIPIHHAGFGSKLAWIADHEQPVVLVGRDDDDGRHAASLAVAIGMRNLAGFLGGGMTSWRQELRPTEVDAARLGGRAARAHGRRRGPADPRRARPPRVGCRPRPRDRCFTTWHDITELPAGLDPDRPIAVICGSGQRSATGASLVRRHGGSKALHIVEGGVPKLGRLGVELESVI